MVIGYDDFKDFVRVKYNTLKEETRNGLNKLIYSYPPINYLIYDQVTQLVVPKVCDCGFGYVECEDYNEFYVDYEKKPTIIPFDLHRFDVLESFPEFYDKSYFYNYHNPNIDDRILSTINKFILIDVSNDNNYDLNFRWVFTVNELYFKYIELFGEKLPLSEDEFADMFNVKRKLW